MAAAGNPNITDQLLKGVKLGEQTYKHLDGYNQMDLLMGRGPSNRHDLVTSAGRTWRPCVWMISNSSSYQQPQGWPGPKVVTDMPTIVNIRQDPFERHPQWRPKH